MRDHDIELAILDHQSQDVPEIPHRQPTSGPRVHERFPREITDFVRRITRLRVVTEDHYLVVATCETVGERVGRSFDTASLVTMHRKSVAEHRDAQTCVSRHDSGRSDCRKHVVDPAHLTCRVTQDARPLERARTELTSPVAIDNERL